MRYALNLPAFGAFADVHALASLAREAEDAGWDGFFIWDHIQSEVGMPVADPWVALCAIALQTEHIHLGALVTPLPRRRPWKLARETATLDRLSGGRLIVGVGSGSDQWYREYSTFGEPVDDKTHAAMLDEGLEVLVGLWSGKPFRYEGHHYTIRDALFLPSPIQSPRIPIWVAGICPIVEGHLVQPEEIREMLTYIRQHRPTDDPFDVVVGGYIGNHDTVEAAILLKSYAEAGVTWWQEGFLGNDTLNDVRERIHQGPPSF
jgi:hypothetical protein